MLREPIIDVKHRPYCGPSAIAILTGIPLSQAEAMIRRGRKGGYKNSIGTKMPIRGTYPHEVVKVLKRLGCKVTEQKVYVNTLAKFGQDTIHAGTFLVEVTRHFVCCNAGQLKDNRYWSSIPVEQYHRALKRVQRVWKVEAPILPKYTFQDSLVAQRPAKPKRDVREIRAEKVLKDIKRWERKEKLAKTKLKKLRSQLKRYTRLGFVKEEG